MTYVVKTSGAPRPVRKDFRCPVHGVFTARATSDDEYALCSHRVETSDGSTPWAGMCCQRSPWSPSVIPMRMRRVEATRGVSEKPQHKGWLDTSALEEGQSPEEFEAERDAIAEDLRKDLVIEAVRSDR